MKKKNIFAPLLLLVLLSVFATCKKETLMQDSSRCLAYDEDVREWMYFQSGTWWLYEEANSKETDSLYVIDNKIHLAHLGTYQTKTQFGISMKSTRDTFTHRYNSRIGRSDSCDFCHRRKGCVRVYRSRNDSVEWSFESVVFIFLPEEGDKRYAYGGGESTISTIYPIYSNGYHTFSDVVKVNVQKDETENYQDVNYFIAKNVGIIRQELLGENKIWNLKSYNIIQP